MEVLRCTEGATDKQSLSIRKATVDDIPRLLELMEHFTLETPYGKYWNKPHAELFVKFAIEAQDYLVLVLETPFKVVGLLAALSNVHPFVPIVATTDLGWWVEPEYRGSRKAIELIKVYEYWAYHLKGATVINMFSMNSPRVDNVYKRLGYTEQEHGWSKFIGEEEVDG